jgi:hypothetical protein
MTYSTSIALAFLFGVAAVGWTAVAIVLLIVLLIGSCGIEVVDESPDGRRRRFRIRRFKDPR